MVSELDSCIKSLTASIEEMASFQFVLPEGAFINRPPSFNGTGYTYWKERMKIFIESIDLDIWDAVETVLLFPQN